MSYNIWSVNGYGICTDDICTDRDRLQSFIRQAPVFEKDFKEWIDGFAEDPDDITLEEMEEYEDEYGYTGIAPIMSTVIYDFPSAGTDISVDKSVGRRAQSHGRFPFGYLREVLQDADGCGDQAWL